MNTLGLYFYRTLVMPLFFLGMILALPFSQKIRSGLTLRLKAKPTRSQRLSSSPWWFHCASGEFEYAKPVIAELKRRDPTTPILVTYFSPSYAAAVEKHPLVDLALPAPIDLPGAVSSFLHQHQPKALFVSRTDLWPEMLHQSSRRGIPRILFAARQREPSRHNWVARFRHSFLSTISAVSPVDSRNFSILLGEPSSVALRADGDPRYDQVAARLAQPKPLHQEILERSPQSPPIFLAGSTWPKDESLVLEALAEDTRTQRVRLILVPHEPSASHVKDLQSLCQKHGLTSDLYSQARDSSWQVLIVDKVGILADLYTVADVAYVGGGFGRGIHSVLEPLAVGLVTFVGPHYVNSREAMDFAQLSLSPDQALKAVTPVLKARELSTLFRAAVQLQPANAGKIKILQRMETQRGASKRLVDFILSIEV